MDQHSLCTTMISSTSSASCNNKIIGRGENGRRERGGEDVGNGDGFS